MTDEALIKICANRGDAMLHAMAMALLDSGDCAPMFSVIGQAGDEIAAGIIAPFDGDEEKVTVFRQLGEFAASQRALGVVIGMDIFTTHRKTEDLNVALAAPRPMEDPQATEAITVQILTARGAFPGSMALGYGRTDDGTVVLDEKPSFLRLEGIGGGPAAVLKALSSVAQRASRSTAVRRLQKAGFYVIGEDD